MRRHRRPGGGGGRGYPGPVPRRGGQAAPRGRGPLQGAGARAGGAPGGRQPSGLPPAGAGGEAADAGRGLRPRRRHAAEAAAPEYIDLLASLAAENGQGGEALVFSAADRDTVGQAVVDAANGKKPGAGFTLAADTRETGGGVVLQRGRMEINCGFAELLRRARQEDSSAVAAVLFD
ncbi:MAG: hypothetical protein ACLUS6_16425 [Dysosmobacter sp.]